MEDNQLKTNIFIIDDNEDSVISINRQLKNYGFSTITANSTKNAIQYISNKPDIILLDLFLPDKEDGFKLLKLFREKLPDSPVIIISGFGQIKEAVQAIKLGAEDFIHKKDLSQDIDVLITKIKKIIESHKKDKEFQKLRLVELGFAGNSLKTIELLSLIQQVAKTNTSVLITGESGTGKELVARAIYELSDRKKQPFVVLNCSAIPTELIESELFGHEKGAFTGATGQRIGKFEQANGGTFFLDEIGDMSLSAQAKVLRVIEDGKFERVGSNKKIEVNVRIIAATNKKLAEEIQKGKFRQDLFYRLNRFPVYISPLRQRKEEILQIASHYLNFFNIRLQKSITISSEVKQAFINYNWPGNIRELMNIIEQGVIKANNEILLEHVPSLKFPQKSLSLNTQEDIDLKKAEATTALTQFESALKETGQITKASEKLYKNRFGMTNRVKAIISRYPDLIEQFPTLIESYKEKIKEWLNGK